MRLHTVGLLSLAAACSDPAEPGTKPSTPSDPPNAPGEIDTALPPPDRDAPGVSSAQAGEADAEPEPESIHRALKRMSVAQTRASMEHLSGGITWTDEQSNLWESYAETLGVADYQTRLRDNLDPSIMYQKFLEDAAVQTCSEWVSGEASGARSPRLFFLVGDPDATDAASVEANLIRLRKVVHGQTSGESDPVIANYQTLFDTVLRRTSDPVAAWTTVCVGLFTHPDFFTY